MRILTKRQERIEDNARREVVERKLRFMGRRIAEIMHFRHERDSFAPVPDLGAEIRQMAEDIAWSDDVIG